METLTVTTKQAVNGNTKVGFIEKQIIPFDKYRFGLLPMMLTAQSCIGGIAAMFIMEKLVQPQHEVFATIELCIVAMLTMAANAVMIAQASPKTCLIAFYAANVANIAFIIWNLF